MADAAKKEDGFLMKAFKLATIGVAAAIAWQMFLDPIFMPIFHDTTNPVAVAFIQTVNDLFGWIPIQLGLTEQQGLLSPLVENLLGDRLIEAKASLAANFVPPVSETLATAAPQLLFDPAMQ